jgi:curved DNA-binding protein CbpA
MQRTHYEILGVPRDATPEQIKRRFRQLAREHHPDVARDKTASHQAFVLISEAYRVLIDPMRRADYDLTLRDRERRQQAPPSGPRPGAAYRPGPGPSTPRGAGRAPGPPPGGPARSSGSARPRPQRADVNQLLRGAQAACAGMRYRDAIQLLQAVLRADPKNALACSLLGDVYRSQGKVDEAIRYYSLAIQFNPNNHAVMEKLDRLLARETVQSRASRSGSSSARTRRPARSPARLTRRQVNQRVFMGAFGFALALFLMLIVEHAPGEPVTTLPWISHWTAALLWLMIIDGMLVGATLSLANMVRPIDEELLMPSIARGGGGVPVGLLLALMGGMFFYMGVAMYTLIGLLQESFSASVFIVFLATFALVVCFAFLAPERAGPQVMLFGGNVIFLSMLAGWLLGDLFRPLWT